MDASFLASLRQCGAVLARELARLIEAARFLAALDPSDDSERLMVAIDAASRQRQQFQIVLAAAGDDTAVRLDAVQDAIEVVRALITEVDRRVSPARLAEHLDAAGAASEELALTSLRRLVDYYAILSPSRLAADGSGDTDAYASRDKLVLIAARLAGLLPIDARSPRAVRLEFRRLGVLAGARAQLPKAAVVERAAELRHQLLSGRLSPGRDIEAERGRIENELGGSIYSLEGLSEAIALARTIAEPASVWSAAGRAVGAPVS